VITRLPSAGDQGSQPCLILFHPASGGGYQYKDLIDREIRENYSVLIVESPFLTTDLPTGDKPTVTQIASQYLPAVTRHLPDGQRVIAAGFSFGGLLAWEFAKLLRQHGCEVRHVINIDQPVPSEIQRCSIGRRVANWMVQLKHPRTMMQEFVRIRKLNKFRDEVQKNKARPDSGLSHLIHLEDFYLAIELGYVPEADGLQMTLIRGEVFMAKFGLPEQYGWPGIAGSLRTVCIPGSHSTLFHKRFIAGLREAFVEALERGPSD